MASGGRLFPNGSTIVKIWYLISGSRLWLRKGKTPSLGRRTRVVYFRPRRTLRAFWQQYFCYARGDGKADLWRVRHAIRYATYLLLIPALLGHGLWGQESRWLGWFGLIAGGMVNCARPWRRLWSLGKGVSRGELLRSALLVPVVRLVGDTAKIAGYPIGLIWRRRNQHRAEIHWREVESVPQSPDSS